MNLLVDLSDLQGQVDVGKVDLGQGGRAQVRHDPTDQREYQDGHHHDGERIARDEADYQSQGSQE